MTTTAQKLQKSVIKDKNGEPRKDIPAEALIIRHVASGQSVWMSGYGISEFQDTLTTDWNSENVFGRMDPIMSYKGTTRKITLGLVSESLPEDEWKQAISRLMKMQYPVYHPFKNDKPNSLAIQSPPIVTVWFMDLIQGNLAGDGLLCAMDGFAYTPKIGFTPEDSPYIRFGGPQSGIIGASAKLSAAEISLKFNFTVLHAETNGFQQNEQGRYEWIAGDTTGIFGPSDDNF